MILTLDGYAAQIQFEITSMISDQNNYLHDTKLNYHFITVILKSKNSFSTNIILLDQVAGLLKSGNKKAFTSHFVLVTGMMQYTSENEQNDMI